MGSSSRVGATCAPVINFTDDCPVPITTVSMDDGVTILSDFILPTDPNLYPIQKIVFLDLLSHDKDIVTSALKQLQMLCEAPCVEKDKNRRRLHIVGAQAVLLLVLKKWCSCPVVMTISYRVLHHGSVYKEFAVAAAKIGLLHSVISGMQGFPRHRLLQQAGCGVLYTMTSVSSSLARTIFTASDGLTLIVIALQNFPSDSYLQKCASSAISVYSGRKHIRKNLRDSGLADALARSIMLDCRKEIDTNSVTTITRTTIHD